MLLHLSQLTIATTSIPRCLYTFLLSNVLPQPLGDLRGPISIWNVVYDIKLMNILLSPVDYYSAGRMGRIHSFKSFTQRSSLINAISCVDQSAARGICGNERRDLQIALDKGFEIQNEPEIMHSIVLDHLHQPLEIEYLYTSL